jgi:hypothetical protein
MCWKVMDFRYVGMGRTEEKGLIKSGAAHLANHPLNKEKRLSECVAPDNLSV